MAPSSAIIVFWVLGKGNLASHIIPFAIGVILDELTQMPYYGSYTRIATIQTLLSRLEHIDSHAALTLTDFPLSIEDVMQAARGISGVYSRERIEQVVSHFISDIRYEVHNSEGAIA